MGNSRKVNVAVWVKYYLVHSVPFCNSSKLLVIFHLGKDYLGQVKDFVRFKDTPVYQFPSYRVFISG